LENVGGILAPIELDQGTDDYVLGDSVVAADVEHAHVPSRPKLAASSSNPE
jgi:hypothetical protein